MELLIKTKTCIYTIFVANCLLFQKYWPFLMIFPVQGATAITSDNIVIYREYSRRWHFEGTYAI